jgi:hypothetical protein
MGEKADDLVRKIGWENAHFGQLGKDVFVIGWRLNRLFGQKVRADVKCGLNGDLEIALG